jgi:hypothetical protein
VSPTFYDSWPAWSLPFMRYGHHLFIAVDQVVTALCGGYPDETVSSYLYRLHRQGKIAGRLLMPVVDWVWYLVFRQAKHCYQAYLAERSRYHLPPELRGG